MGLRIIYGKSGTGKSEFIYDEINNSKDNRKIYIITPEQFSFTAEQKLMEGKKAVIGAEVITFNRLSYRVINEIGGVIHTQVTKCGKAMLIYSILQAEKNNLFFLNKSDENIELCMRLISELKKHGITIKDLKEEKEKIENKYLKNKLNDVIIIYERFEEKIKNKYIDETDLLTILEHNIESVNILKDSIIYIDEFSGFTEQEFLCIKKMINIASQVTITMCMDDINFNTDPSADIFYPNKKTINKIIKLLDPNEKIEKIYLNNLYRFKNDELIDIEENLFNSKLKKREKKNTEIQNVKLFLSKNYYSEIEFVAKQIIFLIKKNNIRFKDIGIITKDVETYSALAKTIFQKYNIPIFIDEKRDLNQNIIIQYILSILEIFIKNFSYESIFNYVKNGFIEIDENDIFNLEKYCVKYGIKHNKFKKDFNYGINDDNKEEINYLNELRKKIINPLVELKNKFNEEKNTKTIIKEFYLFLQKQNIEKIINEKINYLIENNLLDLAKEYEESFQIMINILDEIIAIFGEENITIDKLYQLIKIGLKNNGLGKIPGTQDQVIMGDVDRSRSRKTKYIFIIGLNDGVFPSGKKAEGFIDDADREALKKDGIEIAKGTLENLYDENFNIYKAFTTAEEKIFLSYASSDSEEKSLRSSNLILKIKKIFPDLKEESDLLNKSTFEIVNEKILYENLILKINELKNNKCSRLEKLFFIAYKYFENNKNFKNNLRFTNYKFFENINLENMKKLYGEKLYTSVSKLETYRACPFSYYMKYILKLKEKEELKIQTLDTGTFMHDVIDEFFNEINNSNDRIKLVNLEENDIEIIVEKIINEKLNSINYFIFTATEKYKLLVKRLKRIIVKSLIYIIKTLTQSNFNLFGTELEFSRTGKYKPIVLNLEDGKTIEMTGKIDRIDIAKDENNNYVRIIDYKSSVRNINYEEVYGGLQLQLISYLDAMCKIEDFKAAGILYFNLLEQMISSNKKITEEEIEEKIKKNFKMKGLVLADVNVIKMQDLNLETGYSQMIPVRISTKGAIIEKQSSVATAEEFTKLQNYINITIKEISKEIFNGIIEIRPYYKNKKTPCDYCIYNSICGFNSGVCKKNYRYIDKIEKEDFFQKIYANNLIHI